MAASTLARAVTSGSGSADYLPSRIVVNASVVSSHVTIRANSTLYGDTEVVHSSARSFQLFGSLAPFVAGWALVQALMLELEMDDELSDTTVILSDSVFNVYGAGNSVAEALRDYVASLVELYQIVEKDVHDGVPHTDLEFARLKRYLQHL
ncbi:MAG TPA: hypothetical protein VE338_16845 [Ktedonobacterales bacterium]|jgi:hypothetical protein|nr:hypothetical protein [Ktedonobacterales bacterium]